jgi:hypothetical protein
MAIIKLPNVGDEHTMTIHTCERNTGTYGEQVKFSDGTDMIYLPQTSADMQLKRIFGDNFAYTDAVGNTLKFSRTANNKRPGASPYWNIDPASPPSAPSKRMEAPTTSKATSAGVVPALVDTRAMRDAYVELWDEMAMRLSLSCASHKVTLTADAVQAATATLWIAFSNRGWIESMTAGAADAAKRAESVAMPTTPPPSGRRLSAPVNQPKAQTAPTYDNFPPPNEAHDDLPF